MRDKVFVDLDHRYPRLTFIGDSGLSTNAHDGIVGMHTVDEVFERIRVNLGVGVDLPLALSPTSDSRTHHQANLKVIRGDTHQRLDLSKDIEIQRRHSVIIRDSRKEVHEDQLRIPLSPVSRFLVLCFPWHTALDNDDGRCPMAIFGNYHQLVS